MSPSALTPPPTTEQVSEALARVNDPEIRRPITELGMVKNVAIAPDGRVRVEVYLTVAGCPLRDTITREVTAAVAAVPGVSGVAVALDVMSDEQRRELQGRLRGGRQEREIPFAHPSSLTRVFAVASGKGGVGKSSVTVNLAAALAASGQKVGVLDADIYGHSVPRMLGVTGRPTQVEKMIMPPGTGDIALSVAQLLPGAELIVVTTPQVASSEVAERAGAIAVQTHQRVTGVIENMSGLPCPHCGELVDVFGSGGGEAVAAALTRVTGAPVPLLGKVPIDVPLREGGDAGIPLVLGHPDSVIAPQPTEIAAGLGGRSRGLAGRRLGLSPV